MYFKRISAIIQAAKPRESRERLRPNFFITLTFHQENRYKKNQTAHFACFFRRFSQCRSSCQNHGGKVFVKRSENYLLYIMKCLIKNAFVIKKILSGLNLTPTPKFH